jgi:putative aldouronate transport system permease protein
LKKRSAKGVWLSNTRKNKDVLLLAVPGLLLLLAFQYLPMIGIIIPFKKINYAKGILGSEWVGYENFRFLFSSGDIVRAIRNTLIQNALFIGVTLLVSVMLALVLYEMSGRKVKAYVTAFFFPYFLSWVVVSYVGYIFLNPDMGLINVFRASLSGGASAKINWYMESKYWRGILLIFYVWKNIGYYTIIYYAALMSVDETYYEASAIDGATKLAQIRYISLPLLSPVIVMLTLLQIGKIFFSDFGLFYFVPKNSGALYGVTDVIDTYVFRSLQKNPNIGMTAAAGFCQTVAGFILILLTNFVIKKRNPDYALF